MQARGEGEALLDDGDEHVNRDRDQDLGFDGILGCAEEDFDTKMLFDPFEKQLALPQASIQLGDGDRWQGKVVSQEHQPLAGHRVFEADATQGRGEVLTRVTEARTS